MSEPCKCYEHRHSSNPTDVIGIGKASRILQNAGHPGPISLRHGLPVFVGFAGRIWKTNITKYGGIPNESRKQATQISSTV